MNPELIAQEVESVMTNLTAVHNDLVNCITKSDMTVVGVIASINNNLYPIVGIMQIFVEDKLRAIGLQ